MRFNREDLEDVVFWVFIFLLNWSTFRREFGVPIWQIAGEVALFLAIWFVWKKLRWKRDTKSGNIERASTADSSVLFANYETPSKLVPDTEAALKGIGIVVAFVVAWTVLDWLGLVHGTWMTTEMGTDINVTEVMTDLISAVVFTVVLVLIFRILINALLKRMPLP